MNLSKFVLALSLVQGNHGMQPSDRIRQISGSATVPETAQRWASNRQTDLAAHLHAQTPPTAELGVTTAMNANRFRTAAIATGNRARGFAGSVDIESGQESLDLKIYYSRIIITLGSSVLVMWIFILLRHYLRHCT
ncbi:hypothetical protein PGT21_004079 [Puccinia graminis f. sp. tritici]|uniref:Uncharacterized protein n=1 Tax=Puccinia graminis f. sp. tritici TaxID=56615 RepID=A0A5B0LWK2_PUCGR|nr:hypothetical protein PGT21_004507 [Puccinia graminis f. sp. tritici]KAA1080175.1 hypothetical protein PGTUg99_019799 [Puccinia graminis f. sp. tritici]KAA1081603.1 hypothetical protein PGTUg99_021332 [Puccinia graminis f. sp. tritici]KAA1103902.1 hypothetical protein PGT21_004079 [Puccinia graminis f. sp. tritici]